MNMNKMKVYKKLGVVLMLCWASQVMAQKLFSNRDGQYRIPSIVECKSGKWLAITDHRYDCSDIGNGRHIDIVVKESVNQGNTWSHPERIIAQGGNHIAESFDCAHGDAATVVDRETGEILLMCASGGVSFWDSTREHPQMMGRYYSSDEGKTWKGEEIAKEIYDLVPDMQQAFFTSGRICQSRQIKVGSHYRIYSALTTRKGNRVLYSDDFGKHWHLLGVNAAEAAPKGDEAKIEELPNGDVLISSRINAGRLFNILKYTDIKSGAGIWGETTLSSIENQGVYGKENACNGEVVLINAKDTKGKKVSLLLQSLPMGPKRANVAIFYKALRSENDYASSDMIAKNWEGFYQVSDTTSAYSTMVPSKNGDILFLFEENAFRHPETEPDDYYDIVFKRLGLKAITNGKYHSDEDGIVVLSPQEFINQAKVDTAAIILDVRTPAEYAEGHLERAKLLDYLNTEAFDAGVKSLDKASTYYIYCRSGRRSHGACEKMKVQGFKVFDMEGGYLNWTKLGLPVVK